MIFAIEKAHMFGGVFSGKRVFVTGHTGFKGSWLCEWLLSLDAKVGGLSIDLPSSPSHFELLGLAERITNFVGDVADYQTLKQALLEFKPDIVFHLAAQALVYRSYQEPQRTFLTNSLGTVNFLEALREVPKVAAAVIITSDKCYENIEANYSYRENDRLGGKDPYSASKAAAEIAFRSYFEAFFSEKHGVRLATARAGNVIGGGDWAENRIVPDCVRAWADNRTASIRAPEATRPWQHVLEPLSGYLCLAAALLKRESNVSGEAFNFGPGLDVDMTVGNLVEGLAKMWKGFKWQAVPKDPSKKEATLLSLNCEKALAELEWSTTLNIDETVFLTGDWYRQFYESGRQKLDVVGLTRDQIGSYCELASKREKKWASR